MFFSNITWGKAVQDIEIYADQSSEAEAIKSSFGETNIFLSLILFLFIQVSQAEKKNYNEGNQAGVLGICNKAYSRQ